MSGKRFIALVDETGSAGGKADGNCFFALGATVMNASSVEPVHDLLEAIRRDTRRRSGDVLHFKNFKIKRGHRDAAAERLNSKYLMHAVAASDKSAHGDSHTWTHDHTYFWVITLLMERLSWMAASWGGEMDVILAHKRHMTKEKLAWHESRLRDGRGAAVGNRINWDRIPRPVTISTPQENEFLQLADIFASSAGAALNGEGEQKTINLGYVKSIAPRIHRGSTNKLPTYGFKIHPPSSCPEWVAQI